MVQQRLSNHKSSMNAYVLEPRRSSRARNPIQSYCEEVYTILYFFSYCHFWENRKELKGKPKDGLPVVNDKSCWLYSYSFHDLSSWDFN